VGECSWSAQERTDSTLLPPAETSVGSRVGYKNSLSLLAETIFRCDTVCTGDGGGQFARLGVCTSDTGDSRSSGLESDIKGECSIDTVKFKAEDDSIAVLMTLTIGGMVMVG
jgi:hypothetical protein